MPQSTIKPTSYDIFRRLAKAGLPTEELIVGKAERHGVTIWFSWDAIEALNDIRRTK